MAFSHAVGRQQDDTLNYQQLLTPAELATYNATLNAAGARRRVQDNLTTIQEAVPAGIPLSVMEQQGLSSATWQALTAPGSSRQQGGHQPAPPRCSPPTRTPAIDAKQRCGSLAPSAWPASSSR